jgi:uncharacterized protein (DUF697 family)
MTDTPGQLQSLTFDDFMYFFLRLRKSRVRAVVQNIQVQFPGESQEQLARRLIASFTPLTFLGGSLLHLPRLLPGIGQALQAMGFVMGASVLTRMHLYLILEIALLYGKDIDDQARVPELMAVVAATGAAAVAPLFVRTLALNPLAAMPVAGLTASTTTQMIGEIAIRYYRQALPEPSAPLNAASQAG